jgi:hypothetical protein
MATPEDVIQAKIDYIVKDVKHAMEKPYEMRYDTNGAIPSTNLEMEPRIVSINDFRATQGSEDFLTCGFAIEKLPCDLTDSVFEDQGSITTTYYPLVENLLWRRFPDATGVKILEHNVGQVHPRASSIADFMCSFVVGM